MTSPGRRERKKAQTRQSLAEAALELFLKRGYEKVSVAEVADAADVSVTTLFKHFPSKEALVFDMDAEMEAALVAAIRDRPEDQSIPQALREHIVRGTHRRADSSMREFLRMVEETPALRDYAQRMWLRHETAVAHAIAAEIGAPDDDLTCAALARFALSAPQLISHTDNPRSAAEQVFEILDAGWACLHPDVSARGGGAT